MGVYIKGIEIPKDCPMCQLAHWDAAGNFTGCNIVCGKKYAMSDKEYADSNTRPDWCPLVFVPPHGDLIDRGYAIATACSGRIRTLPTTEDGENWIRVEEVRESIKNAPTIIPASEEG